MLQMRARAQKRSNVEYMFRGKQTPQSQCQKKSNLNLYLSKDIFSAVRLWYFVFYKEIQY